MTPATWAKKNWPSLLLKEEEIEKHVAQAVPVSPWSDDPAILTDGLHIYCGDVEKLHRFCMGVLRFKRAWFQDKTFFLHYDITTFKARARALTGGARPVHCHDLVRISRRLREDEAKAEAAEAAKEIR